MAMEGGARRLRKRDVWRRIEWMGGEREYRGCAQRKNVSKM